MMRQNMKAGIKEICRKCGAKCCRAGIIAMTKEKHTAVIRAGFEDHFRREGDIFFIINNNSVCPYLKDNACTIHEFRPSVCRSWPVHPFFKDGKRTCKVYTCPLSEHLTGKDVENLKKAASGVPREVCELIVRFDRKFGLSRIDKEMGWDYY